MPGMGMMMVQVHVLLCFHRYRGEERAQVEHFKLLTGKKWFCLTVIVRRLATSRPAQLEFVSHFQSQAATAGLQDQHVIAVDGLAQFDVADGGHAQLDGRRSADNPPKGVGVYGAVSRKGQNIDERDQRDQGGSRIPVFVGFKVSIDLRHR